MRPLPCARRRYDLRTKKVSSWDLQKVEPRVAVSVLSPHKTRTRLANAQKATSSSAATQDGSVVRLSPLHS